MNGRIKYGKEDKLRILKEAETRGVKATLDKYNVYPAAFYDWKRKLHLMGEKGLDWGMNPQHLKEIRRLEQENLQLKGTLAALQLETKLKDELLKKKQPWASAKN